MAHPLAFLRRSLTAGYFRCVVGVFAACVLVRGSSADEPQAKPTVAKRAPTTLAKASSVTAKKAKGNQPNSKRQAAQRTARQVDQLLAGELTLGEDAMPTQFGRPVGDDVFLRRIYLDLLGRNPTPEEVTAFMLDPSDRKRATLVDRLLDDAQFGQNWANYWRDVIMYRRIDARGQIAGPALREFLIDQFNNNTPWDEIARSFITATGDVRENGDTGLMMAQNGDTAEITAEVSRIFTGIQIQCAQCHDHKTDRWKREQFHQLAAFFPRVAVRQVRTDDKRTFEVVGIDRERLARRPKARPKGNREHFMPDLDDPSARGTKMDPVFFATGQKLKPGRTDAERRETIARWITSPENEWFAKALVNRIWAELIGEGFYEPIDDLGPDRTANAPKTLDLLARSFADSGYDIKQLYRTITATQAYQRESRSRRNPNETPFVNNCPQRLRGDQLYDALAAVLGIREPTNRGNGPYAALRGPRNQFNQVFGYDPSNPRDEVVGSIPQVLLLMNGPLVNRLMSANQRTELGKLLASTDDNEAVTVELYLRCLGREPHQAELRTCLSHVNKTNNRTKAFEDILWALVNSTEFLHRK